MGLSYRNDRCANKSACIQNQIAAKHIYLSSDQLNKFNLDISFSFMFCNIVAVLWFSVFGFVHNMNFILFLSSKRKVGILRRISMQREEKKERMKGANEIIERFKKQ